MSELVDELLRIADSDDAKAVLLIKWRPPNGKVDWTPFESTVTLADKLREAAAALSRAESERDEAERWKQMAGERLQELGDWFDRAGVPFNTDWQAFIANARAHFSRAEAQRDALQAFKDFVHRRLDEAGVPTHPAGPHSKKGCRIGDRIDIVLAPVSVSTALNAFLKRLNGWPDNLAVCVNTYDEGSGLTLGDLRALAAAADMSKKENDDA